MDWKKLAANVAIYAIGDFLVVAVGGFFLVPLYTRHLSPADYGVFVVTRANSEIFTYILQFGIISAVARVYFIFSAKQQQRQYIGSILIFHFCTVAVFLVVLGVAGNFIWRQLSPAVPAMPYLWIASGLAFLSFVPGLFSILLRVEERSKFFVAVQAISAVLLVLCVILFLVVLKAGIAGLFGALILSGGITWAVLLVLLFRRLQWNFHWEHIRVSLKFGMPVVISYIAFFVMNRFGIIILQRHVGLAEVGLFGLAQQVAMVISLVGMAFGKSFQPTIFSSDESAVTDLVSRLGSIYFISMLLGAAVFASFASELLVILAPRSYGRAYYVLVLLIIANVVYWFKLISESVVLYRNRPNLAMTVSLAGGAISVLGNLWLVPKIGIYGAVLSSLLTSCVVTAASMIVARRMVRFRIGMQLLWQAMSAVGVIGFSVYMNGRISMLLLVPMKIALLSSLGIVFYIFRPRSANRGLAGAANQGD
jgi:O-antigen/teichoic acid export membrane protein